MSDFVSQSLPKALSQECIHEDQPLAGFVDVAGVRQTIRELRSAFPAHFEHAFAAKANSMLQVLRLVRSAGMQCEVASAGELYQAQQAGFEPHNIVYDEPAKLHRELKRVLDRGIALNLDNFQEFERVRQHLEHNHSESRVGFRINPQVGAGSIGPMSTATASSKFGVALVDEGNRQKLLDCYLAHPWLRSLHVHVGSQGCELDLMVAGIRAVTDLANEINQACGRQQVKLIDIGGGLPVNFENEQIKPTFKDYADRLQQDVPELFNGQYRVQTEFGRSILAKNGYIATRVEYTKRSGGRRIAVTHAGAQVATRTVFMPDHWKIRLTAWDPQGQPKAGEEAPQDIAGPLCFAGDMLGDQRIMPLIEPGDLVVLHDTGAYYFSVPFYYNAFPACAVFGVDRGAEGTLEFEEWRSQQTLEQTLAVIG